MSQASVSLATVPSQLVASSSNDQGWRPHGGAPLRVAVLASGAGTNLQAIINRFNESCAVAVVGVASNHADAEALARAKRHQIPTAVFPRRDNQGRLARDREMAAWIKKTGAELVVSAGYLEILSPEFVEQFRQRIINIHPSLLPKYSGLNAIQRAYDSWAFKSGVTIHFVDEGVDTGPVITKRVVWKSWGESLDCFEARIHRVEHKLLPSVIQEIASGRIEIGIPQSPAFDRVTAGEGPLVSAPRKVRIPRRRILARRQDPAPLPSLRIRRNRV
jgi:phosphoribosylglycinamide formyltransferase-1